MPESLTATLTLPQDAVPEAAVRFEGRLTPAKQGIITDDFAPYAVHIYEVPTAPASAAAPTPAAATDGGWVSAG